ncbi:hypothetical protein SUGI_0873370 [Cryptomeria japonica]|nr:hypothetical protein SUGI_0873370 [Cryptomeria japonica]
MSHDFPPKYEKDSLKAYSQAWEILDFIDSQEDDSIMREAVDNLFFSLQTNVEKGVLPPKRNFHWTPKCSSRAIHELAEKRKEKVYNPRDLETAGAYDSMDWREVAGENAMYKLCKSIPCDTDPDPRQLFDELQRTLGEIIIGAIEKAKLMIVEKCSKWAKYSDENNIARALYITGKATWLTKVDRSKQP